MRKIILLCFIVCTKFLFAQPKIVGALKYHGPEYGGSIFRLNLPGTSPGVIHSFNNLAPHLPTAGVIAANDDWLYGMLNFNGTSNYGCLYKIRRDGSGFTVVHQLDFNYGAYTIPYLHTDGFVYFSNTYKLKKVDTATNTVISYDLNNGIACRNLLFDSDDWIYFMTGIHSIVKVKTDGTQETTLHTFNTLTEGSNGIGLTETPGDTLFGVMRYDGSFVGGTIFSIKKDGTGFMVHHQFTSATGIYPESKLVLFDGKLYGTTTQGGSFNNGVLFTINPDGTGYRVLLHLPTGTFNTGSVFGNISIASNGRIFGSFYQFFYDLNPNRLFKIDTSGQNFEPFNNASLNNQRDVGHFNQDILLTDNDEHIFLTTSEMGRHDGGVLSSFDTLGSGGGVFHFGESPNGFRAFSGLIKASDGKLYGTTTIGGSSGNGSVFSMNQDGTGYAKLHEFSEIEGYQLTGKLLEASDGKLYGVCASPGRIYRMDKNGNNFQIIYSFIDAFGPLGSLIEDGGKLYGTTFNSSLGGGSVFSINKDGSSYTTLKNFDGSSDLVYPADGLTVSGNYLYGHCGYGGADNKGGLFRIKKDGSNYQELHVFSGATDGSQPTGTPLMANNGKIYGVATNGGSNGQGIVYRIDSTGSNYMILKNFSDAVDGSYPTGIIQASDGLLYGGTSYANFFIGSGGTVYRMNFDASSFSVIKGFNLDTEGQGVTALLDLSPLIALPVRLLSFTAQKNNELVLLNWKTSQELNSDHFEIERSGDGHIFNGIGNVIASVNSNSATSYAFTDLHPMKGNNYYRLKMVDRDGSFAYSAIVRVRFLDGEIFVGPNPVKDILEIRLPATGDFSSISIFNAAGVKVLQQNITSSQMKVNVNDLPKGLYVVQLNGKNVEQCKIIKN